MIWLICEREEFGSEETDGVLGFSRSSNNTCGGHVARQGWRTQRRVWGGEQHRRIEVRCFQTSERFLRGSQTFQSPLLSIRYRSNRPFLYKNYDTETALVG